MSKEIEWYLIYQDEHLGPYTEASLMELYEGGELSPNSKMWQEGWDEAKEFGDIFLKRENTEEFVNLAESSEVIVEELPPDFPIAETPPIPEVEEVSPPPLDFLKVEDEIEADDSPPPLPIATTETEIDPKSPRKNFNFWPWKGFSVVVLVALAGLLYYQTLPSDFSRPPGLGLTEYKRLLKTAHSSTDKNVFAFSLAPDKKTIWVSTNSDLIGDVNFRFNNEAYDNLSSGAVEIQGVASLNNNLMEINNFEFVQGSKFIDGNYDIDLYTTQDLEIPFIKNIFSNKEKGFQYKGTHLVSNLSKKQFDEALINLKNKEEQNEVEFFETLTEEYRTVQTITNQILAGLKSIFAAGDLNREEARDKFEKDYKQNYGVFFTSFIISVDKKYELISKKEFEDKVEVIAHYAKLKKLALAIGEESIEQLEKMQEIDLMSLSATELRELEFRSTLKYKEIIIECEKMINTLKKS